MDRELASLREAEARIYYRADLDGALDAASLRSIAERRRALLTGEDMMSRAASAMADGGDPAVRRKAELLRLLILLTRIEDDADLLALRHELEQAEQAFKDEMRTSAGMRSYLKATEQFSRERISISNRIARREGFSDYPEAKLTCQELPVESFLKTLAHVRKTCQRECVPVLDSCGAARLSPAELDQALVEWFAYADDRFPAEGCETAIRQTLSAFGLDLDSLPITIESCNLPHSGAVHALKIGKDVRVVMNPARGGFARYALLFHELGHALYYVYAPDSVLLLDSRIGREGLAELWAGVLESRQWLRRFGGLGDSEIEELLARRRRFHACAVMTCVRETMFELEMYRNPQADFLDAWNAVTRECFGIENCCESYPSFVFTYPLDIKDYIYAHLIRASLIGQLEGRFGTGLLKDEVFEYILDSYYGPANSRPWHRRFPVLQLVQ